MGRKVDALNAIAVEQGHTGDEPTSVIGAINAITKAMGGDGEAASIADAITALAPYIGGGGGGGNSSFFTGTFDAGDADTVGSVEIPYTGGGYPVLAMVVVDGGLYNTARQQAWIDLDRKNAVGMWAYAKANETVPTFKTSGAENCGTILDIYKTGANAYGSSQDYAKNVLTPALPSGGAAECVRFSGVALMKYYVGTAANYNYGLAPNFRYRYYVLYSE